jgi:RNase P/RNase MRP subunit p29
MPRIIEVIDENSNTQKYDTSKLNTASIYKGDIRFTVNGWGSKCMLPDLGRLKHDFNFVFRMKDGREFDVRVNKGSRVLGECQGKSNILNEMYIPE